MKFMHLSDLHIGLKLISYDLAEDQMYIFGEIARLAALEKPDAIVIAGDLYDKSIPSAEAVELFDSFLNALTQAAPDAEIMMISGNHDSAVRVNIYRSLLKKQKVHMIGLPPRTPEEHIQKVVLHDQYGDVNFYLLPFVKPTTVRAVVSTVEEEGALSYDESVRRLLAREEIDEDSRNVLVSHQFYVPRGVDPAQIERMDSEIRTVGNIDEVGADVLAPFDYAALGHIHKPMRAGSEYYRYCGTPLAVSVSEAGQQKGVLMVEMGQKGDVDVRVLPLTPLRQVRVIRGTLEEVLEEPSDDYVRVVLTDEIDLDVIDMQTDLRKAFPHLLEIRRETERTADYSAAVTAQEALDPFGLCCSFLPDLSEEEKDILRDVINTVM